LLNRLDINNHNSNCIYIDIYSSGGSGKTYMTIYYLAKIQNKYVQ